MGERSDSMSEEQLTEDITVENVGGKISVRMEEEGLAAIVNDDQVRIFEWLCENAVGDVNQKFMKDVYNGVRDDVEGSRTAVTRDIVGLVDLGLVNARKLLGQGGFKYGFWIEGTREEKIKGLIVKIAEKLEEVAEKEGVELSEE
jgi:hypothetical protein